MERTEGGQQQSKPLVEIASDEAVVRALAQSAHPVEFIRSNGPDGAVAESEQGGAESDLS